MLGLFAIILLGTTATVSSSKRADIPGGLSAADQLAAEMKFANSWATELASPSYRFPGKIKNFTASSALLTQVGRIVSDLAAKDRVDKPVVERYFAIEALADLCAELDTEFQMAAHLLPASMKRLHHVMYRNKDLISVEHNTSRYKDAFRKIEFHVEFKHDTEKGLIAKLEEVHGLKYHTRQLEWIVPRVESMARRSSTGNRFADYPTISVATEVLEKLRGTNKQHLPAASAQVDSALVVYITFEIVRKYDDKFGILHPAVRQRFNKSYLTIKKDLPLEILRNQYYSNFSNLFSFYLTANFSADGKIYVTTLSADKAKSEKQLYQILPSFLATLRSQLPSSKREDLSKMDITDLAGVKLEDYKGIFLDSYVNERLEAIFKTYSSKAAAVSGGKASRRSTHGRKSNGKKAESTGQMSDREKVQLIWPIFVIGNSSATTTMSDLSREAEKSEDPTLRKQHADIEELQKLDDVFDRWCKADPVLDRFFNDTNTGLDFIPVLPYRNIGTNQFGYHKETSQNIIFGLDDS